MKSENNSMRGPEGRDKQELQERESQLCATVWCSQCRRPSSGKGNENVGAMKSEKRVKQ